MRKDPTGRALELLSLLQTHRLWSGAELAARLDITERTVRRDVGRLRELGYPVDAITGKHGGYRLQAGAHLPPLVLDDDEAVAVAVGLSHPAWAGIVGIEDTAARALATIERLLPDRLRRRVSSLAFHHATRPVSGAGAAVDSPTLAVLAAACRDHEHVRFHYRRRDGESAGRLVQPHRLVSTDRRWYLVAWDHERSDWRTFRLDRITELRAVGSHFEPRAIPGGDAIAFVAHALSTMPRPHHALIAVAAPFTDLDEPLTWVDHTVVTACPGSCEIELRADDLDWVVMAVARVALTAPVTVMEPPELVRAVHALGDRLAGPVQ